MELLCVAFFLESEGVYRSASAAFGCRDVRHGCVEVLYDKVSELVVRDRVGAFPTQLQIEVDTALGVGEEDADICAGGSWW